MSENKVDPDADPNISIPDKIISPSSSNLEMVFNKLGSLIKKSMDKQDSTLTMKILKRRKHRKNSTKICILNASSLYGFDSAEEPLDSLLMIISKKSPAKVLTHLYFVMGNFDVVIVQGLATAIRGILTGKPVFSIVNFLERNNAII